jgi:hypothetical protein
MPCATKGLECVFPIWFTQCSRVWFKLAMPCPCHAPTVPFFSRPRQSSPLRDGLWATCPRSASSGYHAEFHEGCYQTHTSLKCRWPLCNQTPFVMDEEKSGSRTLQKRQLHYWTRIRIFPAIMRTFTKDTALSEKDRGVAWHVWINARHDRGTAWARHGYSMLCVNRPLESCEWLLLRM